VLAVALPMKPFPGPLETVMKQNRRSIRRMMNKGVRPMLSEKFFLVLEVLIKGQAHHVPTYADGGPRVVSSSPHVPVVLPAHSAKA
jgi:hypothetical protein